MTRPGRWACCAAWSSVRSLWFAAPLMGDYMRDPRVTDIVHVLAIAPVVSSFGSIGMVTLQRRLEFRQLSLFQLIGKVLSFLIAVAIAVIYRNYWALVFGGFAAQLLLVPLSYVLAPYRPAFSLRSVWPLLHFSKWLFVNNFLTMLDVSLMTLTLGRLNGVRDLGLYQVSYRPCRRARQRGRRPDPRPDVCRLRPRRRRLARAARSGFRRLRPAGDGDAANVDRHCRHRRLRRACCAGRAMGGRRRRSSRCAHSTPCSMRSGISPAASTSSATRSGFMSPSWRCRCCCASRWSFPARYTAACSAR